MIRQYRFSKLMARLTNEEWTVTLDDRGQFIFIPSAYKSRRP